MWPTPGSWRQRWRRNPAATDCCSFFFSLEQVLIYISACPARVNCRLCNAMPLALEACFTSSGFRRHHHQAGNRRVVLIAGRQILAPRQRKPGIADRRAHMAGAVRIAKALAENDALAVMRFHG